MKHFEDVRLGDIAQVPDHSVVFHVVMTPRPIAVLTTNRKPLLRKEAKEAVVAALAEAGFPIVAWIGPEVPGAAVVHCHSALEDVMEDAACAVWALKVLGGWDDPVPMTFPISHAQQMKWITVSGEFGPAGWDVTAAPLRSGKWTAVEEEVARRGDSACAVIFADVDWAMLFNDAYGHSEGDLMLARVYTCIEAAALREKATVFRVEGDAFAVVAPGTLTHALSLAEAIRRDVEAMNIPFRHESLRTQERVTVSLAAVAPSPDLHNALEEAVYRVKRAGRNAVDGLT